MWASHLLLSGPPLSLIHYLWHNFRSIMGFAQISVLTSLNDHIIISGISMLVWLWRSQSWMRQEASPVHLLEVSWSKGMLWNIYFWKVIIQLQFQLTSLLCSVFLFITGSGILLPWTGNRQRKRASLSRERGVLFPCSCRAPSRKQEGLFQLLLSSSCHQVCVLL